MLTTTKKRPCQISKPGLPDDKDLEWILSPLNCCLNRKRLTPLPDVFVVSLLGLSQGGDS